MAISGKRRRNRTRIPVPAVLERALDAALDRALAIQRPAVVAYVNRVRRRRPGATPAQVIELLSRRYLTAVVGTGAAAGGTAVLPGVGTGASLAAGAAEIAAFVSTTALYVLAMAEVHGVPTHDPHVRRALVLTVLLGDVGEAALAGAEIDAKHWAHVLGRTASKDAVRGMNTRIPELLVARFGAKQTALLAGRAVPFGIGAGVGAVGNAALGRSVIKAAGRAFGRPPDRFRGRVFDVVDVDPARPAARSVRRRSG